MKDTIADALNTHPLQLRKDNEEKAEYFQAEKIETLDSDFDLSRDVLINALKTGSESLNILNQLAEQSQSPRAFEVVATLAKNLSEMSKDLMVLHKTKRSMDPKIESGGKTVNNNLFVGSTQELQRFLKEMDLDKD